MVQSYVHEVPPERLPTVSLTLLAGFLGAGKTTLLNHLIRSHQGERIGVLVNDFGDINIDAELVANVDGETITFANGCICCTILDDMVLTLFRLLHRPDAPKHVIIECSGVSDPLAVLQGFEQAKMYDIVRVQSVVAVADAERLHQTAFRDQPLALHQLMVADLIVLNKIDLVPLDERAGLEERLRTTVPKARVLVANHGRVPFDLVLGTGNYDLERLLERPAHDHANEFGSWSHQWVGPIDPDAFRAFVDELPASIYRAKGIVEVPGESRRAVVQVVGKRVEVVMDKPWPAGERISKFVVVGISGQFRPELLEQQLVACVREPRGRASLVSRWIRHWRPNVS